MPDAEGAGLPDRPQSTREYSGPWSTLGLAALVIIVVGGLVWWFEFRGTTSGGSAAVARGIIELPDDLNSTGKPPAADPGRAAPDFELKRPDGLLLKLSDFRGQYVLVNFWASWCGPCRVEAPQLNKLAVDLDGRLVVLGVNQQESLGAVEAFVSEFSLTHPIVLDSDGEVSTAYRVGQGLPVTFLLDPEGLVVSVMVGGLRQDQLAEIRKIASE